MAEDAPKRLNAEEVKAKVAECREMATRAKFPASCSNTSLGRGSGSLARWRPSTRLAALLLRRSAVTRRATSRTWPRKTIHGDLSACSTLRDCSASTTLNNELWTSRWPL